MCNRSCLRDLNTGWAENSITSLLNTEAQTVAVS